MTATPTRVPACPDAARALDDEQLHQLAAANYTAHSLNQVRGAWWTVRALALGAVAIGGFDLRRGWWG